ncbi:lysosomal aspartic protease-like [Dermacentor albipictus]|uniref:lysosomal aspartic protease-like n=1 Tax=Dermacentor albipictus TaxID=60249 RepID=UPI0031FDE91A
MLDHLLSTTFIGLLCFGAHKASRPCLRQTEGRGGNAIPGIGILAVPLTNYNNLQYFCDLNIGSPWQSFKAAFDTAGASWVLSTNCKEDLELCRGRNKYDPRGSSTHVDGMDVVSAPLGNGTVHGMASWDRQQVAGVTVPRMPFLRIGNFTGQKDIFWGTPSNAVLGLEQGPLSFFGALVRERLLAEPWLGLYFSRDDAHDGEALFGGANSERYEEPLSFFPALGTYWNFQLDAIEMGQYGHYCFTGCIARPATADPYIGGPPIEIQRINTDIGAMKVDSGEWMLDCDSIARLHDIRFTIGTRTFVLQPKHYIVQRDTPNGKRCYSGFIEAVEKGDVTWHLGHVFLRRVYTVLVWPTSGTGYGQVGFAYAR